MAGVRLVMRHTSFAVTLVLVVLALALPRDASAWFDATVGTLLVPSNEGLSRGPGPRTGPLGTGEGVTIRWRKSKALGTPGAGRLVRGVRFPAEGDTFFTWDPVLHASPNRAWRRWGTDELVRVVLRVIRRYEHLHPFAPRVGIGDLSLRRGGYFGPKHATHQNGLDVDVYYPRRDRRERPPKRVEQIDHRLAQSLLDLFVAAGVDLVYIGPNTRLAGPPAVVRPLWNHDNHLHVRIVKPSSPS
jgi:Penicillin-insensitive murein endopeptidase